jgi:hypothetical protein
MHPGQRIFRRGWWNDVIYLFVNGWLTKLGILLIIVGVMVVSTWLVVRAAMADQPTGFRSDVSFNSPALAVSPDPSQYRGA